MAKMTCVEDYERFANEHAFSQLAKDYYGGGTDDQLTLHRNKSAFSNILIRPEVLHKPMDNIDTSVVLLGGHKLSFPICVSPSAFHKIVHTDGEVATAKGCKGANTVMTLAIWSSTPMESVYPNNPNNMWQNLYLHLPDKQRTFDQIKRAEKAGAKALVVTCDAPSLGKRRTFAPRKEFVLYSQGHYTSEEYLETKDYWHNGAGATWDYFAEVCRSTYLPVVAKGILTGKDALRAVEHGAKAVLVSNHGGRGLDSAPASIEMLPEVVAAVGDRCEVYVDGGVRMGKDVFKALALGANAVFVGRPALWGLAYDGSSGVTQVIEHLQNELKITMAFAGCSSLKDITREKIIFTNQWTHTSGTGQSVKSHL